MNDKDRNITIPINVNFAGRFILLCLPYQFVHAEIWNEAHHQNSICEFHMVVGGKAEFEADGSRVPLNSSQAVLVAPGVFHSSETGNSTVRRMYLGVVPMDHRAQETLAEVLKDGVRTVSVDSRLRTMISVIEDELSGDETNCSVITSAVSLFFAGLLRNCGIKDADDLNDHAMKTDYRVREIDGYFAKRYADASENELAGRLGVSRRQLLRLLREEYGMTFSEMLVATRMERAAWLLKTSSLTVAEISANVGYMSETSFFKQFIKKYGTTPQKYRKKM